MKKLKHGMQGDPKKIVIEIGPLIYGGPFETEWQLKRYEKQRMMVVDALVRDYYRIGKRNKAVQTRMEEE
jgi:hypothetical protein